MTESAPNSTIILIIIIFVLNLIFVHSEHHLLPQSRNILLILNVNLHYILFKFVNLHQQRTILQINLLIGYF